MISTLRTVLGLAALAGASSNVLADAILKVDGARIDGVDVQEENLTEVIYRRDRSTVTVPSAEVLEVTFERKPQEVDEALAALAEGDVIGAMQTLDRYVSDQIERLTERRYRWAPAFAAWKAIELHVRLADLEGAIAGAQRLIDAFPDSRYVPQAYLTKASAEFRSGNAAAANRTLSDLADLISRRSLAKRWDLACRLAQAQYDGRDPGESKRGDLTAIVEEAGSGHPTVAERARLAVAESYLQQAEGTLDAGAAVGLRQKAQSIFEELIEAEGADDETKAGAHTGLGDCLFFRGASAEDEEVLTQAAMHYLRTVLVYPESSQYVPKALFYAMRCFQLMGDRARQADMRRELQRLYPNSAWAQRPEVRDR